MEKLWGIYHPEDGIEVGPGIHVYYETEQKAIDKAKSLLKRGFEGPLKVYKLELVEVLK